MLISPIDRKVRVCVSCGTALSQVKGRYCKPCRRDREKAIKRMWKRHRKIESNPIRCLQHDIEIELNIIDRLSKRTNAPVLLAHLKGLKKALEKLRGGLNGGS